VRTLVTEAVVNESGDPELLLKRAERQIKELKQELAMRDMLRWGCRSWHRLCDSTANTFHLAPLVPYLDPTAA
jgi:kinesin family protein 6/9